ncbi:AMP-binding protein [Aliiglaciecola sp. LCG003]|uniref:AMP-binding protein n=1 Tax=Aliiglaciecola sp. LCG003 TaxID=3053655 RepID=UPI0025745493|nr:AMP-binding protein [Aliiglaciecola sp. LCG003]WJG09596.1 AMP-binding protein [Aliiglaciecola sp. LCG003]
MDFLSLHAHLRPNSLAVTDLSSNRQWTYAEFDLCVAKVTAALKHQGVSKSERVACLAKNRAEIIALHLACARLGAIFVPLNWRLTKEELQNILFDCEPSLLYADELGEKHQFEYQDISQLLAEADGLAPQHIATIDQQLPSLILYTSGTTGKPKGVMLSEGNLAETAINFALLGQVDSRSSFLCESPMFHIIGLISSIRPALYFGAKIVISDGFIPQRTLARLMDKALAISHYFCVPQMANALRQEASFSADKLQHLTAIFTGGAPHPEVQIRSWLNDNIPIVDGYGMSEAGTVFGMPVDIDLIDKKAGCVGFPTHRIKTRLVDDNDNPIAKGSPGEVQIKGNNIAIGYWRRESEFAATMTTDGWFRTGDIAIEDSDGYFRIVDRKKDMFISGGENVYPTEIESIALKHEAIQECAVIGVPDQHWGEVGCLFLVIKENHQMKDKQGFTDFLGQHLARYKLPKHIVFADSLPRNGAGKVMKNLLKLT